MKQCEKSKIIFKTKLFSTMLPIVVMTHTLNKQQQQNNHTALHTYAFLSSILIIYGIQLKCR